MMTTFRNIYYHSGLYHINNVTNTSNRLSVSADVSLFEISQTKG